MTMTIAQIVAARGVMMTKKAKPILFSGPMIRAYYDGRKTMTRRIAKPKKDGQIIGSGGPGIAMEYLHTEYDEDGDEVMHVSTVLCPYGEPGDCVWVKETWQHSNYPHGPYAADCNVFYRADYLDDPHGPDGERSAEGRYRKWRSSLLMPLSASRLVLTLSDVTVQRLLEITEEDAIDEGARSLPDGRWTMNPFEEGFEAETARDAFLLYWDHLNGQRGLFSTSDPFVWVVSFPRFEK